MFFFLLGFGAMFLVSLIETELEDEDEHAGHDH